MSVSPILTQRLQFLLWSYQKRSIMNCDAFKYAGHYYTRVHRYASLISIILAATATSYLMSVPITKKSSCDDPDADPFIISITCLSTIVTAGIALLNPSMHAERCLQMSTQFDEIGLSIEQFIREDIKSRHQYKAYSNVILERITIWEANAPDIPARFVLQAEAKHRDDTLMNNLKMDKFMSTLNIDGNVDGNTMFSPSFATHQRRITSPSLSQVPDESGSIEL